MASVGRASPGRGECGQAVPRGPARQAGPSEGEAKWATAVARLYGPFTSLAAVNCTAGFRVRQRVFHVHNGLNRTPRVRVGAPGVYTWAVTLRANAANRSVTHRCGQAVETTVVAKQTYPSPAVPGGFSGLLSSFDGALRAPAPFRIRMRAIGMRAPVRRERISAGEMTLPGDVGEVGWLRRSADVGDKIGNAVIGGHVSDRHDNPGAMFRLNRAQAGQQVTVHRAGKIYRYKVVRKAAFDRRREIPHRYFATTGPHCLVLVSCTAKVVFANGRFHDTRSLVVVAKPVQHRRQHQQLWARGRREPAGSGRER